MGSHDGVARRRAPFSLPHLGGAVSSRTLREQRCSSSVFEEEEEEELLLRRRKS